MPTDPNNSGTGSSGAPRTAPSEIARETLKQLAARRLPPTPENYQRTYQQIAGEEALDLFPTEALRGVANALPRGNPSLLAVARQFERAIAHGSWASLRNGLASALQDAFDAELPWASLLLDLLRELESERARSERAARLQALLQVLALPLESAQIHHRLDALLRDWRRGCRAPASPNPGDGFSALLGNLLRSGVVPMLVAQPALAEEAHALSQRLMAGNVPADEATLTLQLKRLGDGLELARESEGSLRAALIELLRLIIDNIRLLVVEDHWLHGQMSLLSEALDGALDIRALEEVGRRLRKVIEKQGHLTRQIADAQQRLKLMLTGFIDRLGQLTDSTSGYHDVLADCASRIAAADHLDELAGLVQELLAHTEATRDTAARSARELALLRERVEAANQSMVVLQRELEETSLLVRHDPLTGALNRKGLDEVLEREISRMQRMGTRLCVAVLDVDNFKIINDTHGHLVGDEVLRHLTTVLRDTLRANDSVVRYGGEEFVLLLPGIVAEEAQTVVVRLQRELTKRFFMANAQKLLLTFSAGVTDFGADEDPSHVIERADKAMYAAKHAGKNRVMVI